MLFKDIQTLKKYSDVANGAAFERLKSIMETVERNSIVAILGKALYTTLDKEVTEKASEGLMADRFKKLLDPVRKVLGPLVVYHYAPFSELNMTDSGLTRAETTTVKTAFGYQSHNYRRENMRLAEIAIEQLYEFLEENKADYSEWTESDAFKKYSSLFIRSGKEFGELFASHSPYRNYYAMRSKMTDVEVLYIRGAIDEGLFAALRQAQGDNQTIPEGEQATPPDGFVFVSTEDINKAVFMLKKAIAYYTVAFAVPYLNVRIDEDGITVVSDNSSKEADKRTAANNEAISFLLRNCTDTAQKWLAEVKQVTKYWLLDENGVLLSSAPLGPDQEAALNQQSCNGLADECDLRGITIDLGIQRAIKAEDYNPREGWCEPVEKKSFIM